MEYKSSAELKRMANGQLKGKYGISIGVFLIYLIIIFAIEIIISIIFDFESSNNSLVTNLISIIISLLFTVFSLGYMKFHLNLTRNRPLSVSNLFWGFSHHPDKIIIATVLQTLLYFAVIIPFLLFYIVYVFWGGIFFLLLAIIYIIAAYVFLIILSLTFSQVSYLLADDPEKSPIEVLKESRSLMKDHKGRLFYIHLSFIGWFLLGILSCGIGFLWLIPYYYTTLTFFYLDITDELYTKEQIG